MKSLKPMVVIILVLLCIGLVLLSVFFIRYEKREKEAKQHYNNFLNIIERDENVKSLKQIEELQILIKDYSNSKYTKELLDKINVPYADKDKYYESIQHWIAAENMKIKFNTVKRENYGERDGSLYKHLLNLKQEYEAMIKIYPDSPQVKIVKGTLITLNNALADSDWMSANYLIDYKDYNGALVFLKNIITKYSETQFAAPAKRKFDELSAEIEKNRVRTPQEADNEWLSFRNNEKDYKGKITTWKMEYIRRGGDPSLIWRTGQMLLRCWLNGNTQRDIVLFINVVEDVKSENSISIQLFSGRDQKSLVEHDQLVVTGEFLGVNNDGSIYLKPIKIFKK